MDVLFAMPPGGTIPWFAEHLGTAFLRAMLARAGITSEPYLSERNPSLVGFARFLEERRPSVVGFTVYESNMRACRAMAGVAREVLPEAIVIVGGPNATFSPEETLDLLRADACLRGAGEGTIVAIVEAILGAERPRSVLPELLADVPNLVIRTDSGVLRTRGSDLSSFPSACFRHLDDIPSPYLDGLVRTVDIGYLTARGCNQHCTYCSFGTISGRRIHFHGVERVLDDLAALKALAGRIQRRRRIVPMSDDAFTLAPQRARAICEGIIRRGLELPFECATRADHVDADLLRLMRRAGFESILFGLESAEPRVLRAIGKVQDPETRDDPAFEAERIYLERLRAAVVEAKRAGLTPSVSIIGGLPAETAKDLRTTLAFVESLDAGMYVHNVLELMPGTPLYEDRARWGLAAERDVNTGTWRTTHSYDVASVRPLKSAMTYAFRWEEAREIADALCGRPRRDRAGENAAWAVVLHRDTPDRALAAWLAQVLAVHGTVVVVSPAAREPSDWRRWVRTLDEARVPSGLFALLSREVGASGESILRSVGTRREHRFEIRPRWDASRGPVQAEDGAGCVPMWIASASVEPPPGAATESPFVVTPDIADGCRFWSGWRRCRDPRVLHVHSDATVGPCWTGPAIGIVGDTYDDLAARARALGRAGAAPLEDRCPLQSAKPCAKPASDATEQYEVAAQMCWTLRRQAAGS